MSVAYLPTAKPDLAAQLSAMTDERDHYKRELGMVRDQEVEALVQHRLGLSPKEAALLMVLHSRRGRPVSRESLMDAMYDGMDEPEAKIMDVFVTKLRAKIGDAAIDTIRSKGWLLTDVGVETVSKAMTVSQ